MTRTAIRRMVLIAALLTGLAGVKLVSVAWFADRGHQAYEVSDYGGSEDAYEMLLVGNVVERWKAPNNVGVARFLRHDLSGAEHAFRDALSIDPNRCDVRFNLVITIEASGDERRAAGDVLGAQTRFQEAADLVSEADCRATTSDDSPRSTTAATTADSGPALTVPPNQTLTSSPPKVPTTQPRGESEDVPGLETSGGSDPGKQLQAAGRRIEAKLRDVREGDVTGDTGPNDAADDTPNPPDESQRNVLDERRREANRQRHQARSGVPPDQPPPVGSARW